MRRARLFFADMEIECGLAVDILVVFPCHFVFLEVQLLSKVIYYQPGFLCVLVNLGERT